VVSSILRIARTGILATALYLVLPLEDLGRSSALLLLLAGLAVFVLTLGAQLRSIVEATHPRLRAIELAATGAVLLIIVFSAVYVALSNAYPEAFSEPLDRAGAIYFCVTVLATVGFGDIVPRSDGARLIVAAQMLLNLVLLGAVARIMVEAARRGVERQSQKSDDGGGPIAPAEP
jgi:voltage-gated potassium channel